MGTELNTVETDAKADLAKASIWTAQHARDVVLAIVCILVVLLARKLL
jgi:hypothetical protein